MRPNDDVPFNSRPIISVGATTMCPMVNPVKRVYSMDFKYIYIHYKYPDDGWFEAVSTITLLTLRPSSV